MVKKGRLSRRLRSKDGDEVVVEARFSNSRGLEIVVQVGAVAARDFVSASDLFPKSNYQRKAVL